jgi:flagellar motor switch protein FliM
MTGEATPDAAADGSGEPSGAVGLRGSNAMSDEEVSALLEKNAADPVRPYDLTTQRINRTQLPMLEVIAKSFAERATGSLSGLLGREASMQFTSIELVRAVDLQVTLPVPASVAVVRFKPLAGFAFVRVDPDLLLALLDGFFGGSGRAAADSQAAVAPAAQRFLALLLRSLSADLAAAWTPVTPIELELVKQEINPRLLQLGGPQDSLIVVRFTAEFGARSGALDWLLPEHLLAPVRESLATDGGKAPVRTQEAWAPLLSTSLQEAEMETRAILAQAEISLRELVSLTPGDIIPIEPPQNVTLLAGEVPLYRGRFGISRGRNALKILPGGPA